MSGPYEPPQYEEINPNYGQGSNPVGVMQPAHSVYPGTKGHTNTGLPYVPPQSYNNQGFNQTNQPYDNSSGNQHSLGQAVTYPSPYPDTSQTGPTVIIHRNNDSFYPPPDSQYTQPVATVTQPDNISAYSFSEKSIRHGEYI